MLYPMNIAQYRNKYGHGSIYRLSKKTGVHTSQLYGCLSMSFEKCEELAEGEPELDAMMVYRENKRLIQKRKKSA